MLGSRVLTPELWSVAPWQSHVKYCWWKFWWKSLIPLPSTRPALSLRGVGPLLDLASEVSLEYVCLWVSDKMKPCLALRDLSGWGPSSLKPWAEGEAVMLPHPLGRRSANLFWKSGPFRQWAVEAVLAMLPVRKPLLKWRCSATGAVSQASFTYAPGNVSFVCLHVAK